MRNVLKAASFRAKTQLLRPSLMRAHRGLEAAARLDPEQILRLQRERSIAMARFAFENTEFYRTRYTKAGFSLGDLSHAENFQYLPTISKRDIREHSDEIVVENVPARFRLSSTTGGSTGEPLTLYHDRRAPVAAMWWRVYRWWGVLPSDNRAYIQREGRTRRRQRVEQIEWWPTIQLFLNARAMTNSSMEKFVSDWNRYRPVLLNGYVGGVHEFARFIQEQSLSIARPRAIGVTASPITRSQRSYLEDILKAPVYDQYRSSEVPWIAAQCRMQSGLHVLSDLRVVEIVDEAGLVVPDGTDGEVIVSDLTNRVFPILRYRLGDRTSKIVQHCACKLPFERLSEIKGRVIDMLWLPSGRRISGVAFTGIFNEQPEAVKQFQIHQLEDYSIMVVCVVGSRELSGTYVQSVADSISQIVDHEVPVSVEYVPEIQHEGGKVRVVRSDVVRPTQENGQG